MQIIYTFLAGIMPSTTGIKLSPNSLGPWFSIIYNSIYPSSACDYFGPIGPFCNAYGPLPSLWAQNKKKNHISGPLSEATITIKPAQYSSLLS